MTLMAWATWILVFEAAPAVGLIISVKICSFYFSVRASCCNSTPTITSNFIFTNTMNVGTFPNKQAVFHKEL